MVDGAFFVPGQPSDGYSRIGVYAFVFICLIQIIVVPLKVLHTMVTSGGCFGFGQVLFSVLTMALTLFNSAPNYIGSPLHAFVVSSERGDTMVVADSVNSTVGADCLHLNSTEVFSRCTARIRETLSIQRDATCLKDARDFDIEVAGWSGCPDPHLCPMSCGLGLFQNSVFHADPCASLAPKLPCGGLFPDLKEYGSVAREQCFEKFIKKMEGKDAVAARIFFETEFLSAGTLRLMIAGNVVRLLYAVFNLLLSDRKLFPFQKLLEGFSTDGLCFGLMFTASRFRIAGGCLEYIGATSLSTFISIEGFIQVVLVSVPLFLCFCICCVMPSFETVVVLPYVTALLVGLPALFFSFSLQAYGTWHKFQASAAAPWLALCASFCFGLCESCVAMARERASKSMFGEPLCA